MLGDPVRHCIRTTSSVKRPDSKHVFDANILHGRIGLPTTLCISRQSSAQFKGSSYDETSVHDRSDMSIFTHRPASTDGPLFLVPCLRSTVQHPNGQVETRHGGEQRNPSCGKKHRARLPEARPSTLEIAQSQSRSTPLVGHREFDRTKLQT